MSATTKAFGFESSWARFDAAVGVLGERAARMSHTELDDFI